MTAPETPPTLADVAILCPHCAYDVRGRTNRICPECGSDNPPDRLINIATETARMRHRLRFGMWATLGMWLVLLFPFVGGSYLFRGGPAKWTPYHTAIVVAMLVAASVATWMVLDVSKSYRHYRAHLAPEVDADLRGRFVTIFGLMIGPTLLAVAIRPFL